MKITSIKQQTKRKDRYSIFVDGVYAFSFSEAGLLTYGLVSGQELDRNQLQKLKKTSGEDKAYGNALRYVAMRPRSEWEVTAYLKRKAVSGASAQHIVERLKKVELLNDYAFARSWVASRRQLKSISKRRLISELNQKHVAENIINKVLQKDTASDLDALRELVQKKQARYPDRTRLMQYLARQGFNYDDIKRVVNEELVP